MIKRPRIAPKKGPLKESLQLVELATFLGQASCRAEDRFWEARLDSVVTQVLCDHDEASLSGALDRLFGADAGAYGALIDSIETCSESLTESIATPMQVVLIAMPVLAWSRFPIPAGRLTVPMLAALRAQLHGHILASTTRLCLVNHFFSPDQLPQSYSETRALTQRLASSAIHERDFAVDSDSLPDTAAFLSDTRYVLGAVAIPPNAPLFRWQEDNASSQTAYRQWEIQVQDALRPLLPACAFELQPPTAYHTALRDADRASRPYSVVASIDFLKTVLGCDASALAATVGSYFGKQLEEYRIGFGLTSNGDILHGVVWPVLDPEDELPEAVHQIESLLKSKGVGTVTLLNQRLPVEFCDDCGAPLFPNADGESTHAELPEEINSALPKKLH